MKRQLRVLKGNHQPYGITPDGENGINIAIAMESQDCGIILYDKKKKETEKIAFDPSFCIGELYCVRIEGICTQDMLYRFYDGGRIFVDTYARSIAGNETYGKLSEELMGRFTRDDFDWEGDETLQIPFCDSLIYLLHVRGFTKHASSHVAHRGTFEGLVEKIPHLKNLGITTVELMPAYEFLELEKSAVDNERIPMVYRKEEPVLNYWGYKAGYYYAPKSAYATDPHHPGTSFKNMVKAFHQNKMEVLMQFYFPNFVSGLYIVDVLRYWVCEYHVDGFHLMGERIPTEVLAKDPMLKRTKLIYYGFPAPEQRKSGTAFYKNLAQCRDEYMYDMRRFLKSDERMLGKVLQHMKTNPKDMATIHYITETNGFTLADLVSYDRKHNLDNGENDLDGNPYNASWNCGTEGRTRKKPILDLRMKQMKNAFLLSLFTQSTPLILAGDEFANSQNGNNNAYCQDNAINWINWNDQEKAQELYDFVKEAIAFRKAHAMLHRSTEYTLTDELAYGYPDLSYHSEEPWKCAYDDLTRHFGMLYFGAYSEDVKEKDTFIFLAVNMHWVEHEFVLPKLKEDKKWKVVFDTSIKKASKVELPVTENSIAVKERSIQVLVAE